MIAQPPPKHTMAEIADLQSYTRALHAYTQSLWQEARRSAELKAQENSSAAKKKGTSNSTRQKRI